VPGAPQLRSSTIVLSNPAHEIAPPLGGGLVEPCPAWLTNAVFEPASPETVYEYVTVVDSPFDGIVSTQLFVPLCDSALPPDSDVFAPQLVDTETLPPEAGNEVGETLIEQLAVPPPASTQFTMMVPFEPGLAVKLLQASVALNVGTGTANPVEATAAASTRLMERLICMVYLEKRRRRATYAQCKHCAIYRMF
jgi:hypothetical protein